MLLHQLGKSPNFLKATGIGALQQFFQGVNSAQGAVIYQNQRHSPMPGLYLDILNKLSSPGQIKHLVSHARHAIWMSGLSDRVVTAWLRKRPK
jgi:hypothetical protein